MSSEAIVENLQIGKQKPFVTVSSDDEKQNKALLLSIEH